jgi:hypothetical protein
MRNSIFYFFIFTSMAFPSISGADNLSKEEQVFLLSRSGVYGGHYQNTKTCPDDIEFTNKCGPDGDGASYCLLENRKQNTDVVYLNAINEGVEKTGTNVAAGGDPSYPWPFNKLTFEYRVVIREVLLNLTILNLAIQRY